MNRWQIALRSIRQRGLASALTCFSMALGVMLVVCVLSVYGIVDDQFRNNASLGYNLIVGAKGGKLQLTLNTVYYLSQPVENIDYKFYLEFFDQQRRDAALKGSLQYQAHQARWNVRETSALAASAAGLPGCSLLGVMACQGVLQEQDAGGLELGRDGRFAAVTGFVIPLCLGDYFDRFRVVGTTPDMFEQLVSDDQEGQKRYEFAQGRNFQHWNDEHGYFEAVVGATVARELNVVLDQMISPTHGDPQGHGHERGFVVVGILKPSGTPNDRAVFVNMEGFYLMADHAKPVAEGEQGEAEQTEAEESPTDDQAGDQGQQALGEEAAAAADHEAHHPAHFQLREGLPIEQREVTALLLRTANMFVAANLQNFINEGPEAQAVQPVKEIYDLLDLIVRPVQYVLLTLTVMICLVSGVSILVSIYNSMNDRKHEIAVMRALGARRGTVMTIILLESIMLSLAGGALGWIMGHTLNWLASDRIEQQTGVSIGFFDLAPPVNILELLGREPTIEWLMISSELLLIPALIVLAVLVGFVPAWTAYNTDVGQSLGK